MSSRPHRRPVSSTVYLAGPEKAVADGARTDPTVT